ncbi:pre-rRNA processing protein [Metarhizium guizhouense ARSEF 977]|uniref:Pre-rRNA processing protein n=1 Tax=Metarhizium guizhouense (strain ARSEF 977) TaxID=1276136 RepID=A0A0B4HH30_METGA|nr:pre-rRNA processing protein [Metarhizium guizhouense ARSEF 977]
MAAYADERSPLLATTNEQENETGVDARNESSPLLGNRRDSATDGDHEHHHDISPDSPHKGEAPHRKRRWPSLIAMVILASLVIVVMVLGFVVPPAVQQYVESAVVLEPTDLSIESLTANGVRARVKATFQLDGSRVKDENARRVGRLATGIMRQLGTAATKLRVHLPHYGNALVGTADLPPITLNLVDGQVTNLDFVTEIAPGDTDTMRKVVNEWLKGNLETLQVTGATALRLKSGIFPLGTHDVSESMVFEANELPSMPEYTMQSLVFHDVPTGDNGQMGVGANVSMTAYNEFPIDLTIPSLGFEVLVPNCNLSQLNIKIATAATSAIDVHAKSNVTVEAEGIIRELPESLTKACPPSEFSPLDNFMKRYLHGEDAEVFVRGKAPEGGDLPGWIGEFIESITVPVQFPGRSLDNFLRNFSLDDVDFKLPSPFADPSDADSKPRVSGTVLILAAIPADLDINIEVTSLRANGDLLYKGTKFGELHVDEWQKATSNMIHNPGDGEDLLKVVSRIVDTPIDITDSDTFSNIIQELLFGDEDIILDVNSTVDVKVSTVLGNLVIRRVPAAGKVPVKHVPGDTLAALNPQVGDVHILNTSSTGVHIQASVNVTNPTPYTASIPYVNIHILEDNLLIGEAITKNLHFKSGVNTNIIVEATWDPPSFGGKKAHQAARRLLSEYLSGKNTTITLRTHNGTIPTVPIIGEALSKINLTLSTPRLELPGDEDTEGQGFIRDATFHILSSTATFMLASPLRYDTVSIEYINATAFYNHTEPIGQIIRDEPFDVSPGVSQTPRLPVEWSADHMGLDKLKKALGGKLKLDAVADVTVRVGYWFETVHYVGKAIGARVSL